MFNKSCNGRQVTIALGVDHRNIKRAYERQRYLDTNHDVFWVNKKPRERADGLCEAIIQQIQSFWTSETIVSPNAKDITHKRIGVRGLDMWCMLPIIFRFPR
jgi:hypothetical protein